MMIITSLRCKVKLIPMDLKIWKQVNQPSRDKNCCNNRESGSNDTQDWKGQGQSYSSYCTLAEIVPDPIEMSGQTLPKEPCKDSGYSHFPRL